MAAMNNLPAEALTIADQQGWDEESVVIHLTGFIAREGLDDKLTQYLAAVADEENAEAERLQAD